MSEQQQPPPLRVALLGAGIFATTSHAPIINKNPKVFNCVAVWSRRQESAEKLAATLKAEAFSAEEGLEHVLQLPDLDAVIMALPLDVQPKYVILVLEAGKHVLSEKPIAATLSEAKELLRLYYEKCSSHNQKTWSVAENFRYEPGILRTEEAVKKEIGKPFLISLNIRAPFLPDNQYLNTLWRKEPSWYGGLFIDAFVHASAMLRLVLGCEAKTVSAITCSQADYIPSVDTMVLHVVWESGGGVIQGAVSVTYASCSSPKLEFEVTGTEGTVLLQRKLDGPGYQLRVNNNKVEEYGFGGIEGEFLAFAAACRGEKNDRNTPDEAVKDLAFVEACLKSGQNNGEITKVVV